MTIYENGKNTDTDNNKFTIPLVEFTKTKKIEYRFTLM